MKHKRLYLSSCKYAYLSLLNFLEPELWERARQETSSAVITLKNASGNFAAIPTPNTATMTIIC